jgi:hypothetical protein
MISSNFDQQWIVGQFRSSNRFTLSGAKSVAHNYVKCTEFLKDGTSMKRAFFERDGWVAVTLGTTIFVKTP